MPLRSELHNKKGTDQSIDDPSERSERRRQTVAASRTRTRAKDGAEDAELQQLRVVTEDQRQSIAHLRNRVRLCKPSREDWSSEESVLATMPQSDSIDSEISDGGDTAARSLLLGGSGPECIVVETDSHDGNDIESQSHHKDSVESEVPPPSSRAWERRLWHSARNAGIYRRKMREKRVAIRAELPRLRLLARSQASHIAELESEIAKHEAVSDANDQAMRANQQMAAIEMGGVYDEAVPVTTEAHEPGLYAMKWTDDGMGYVNAGQGQYEGTVVPDESDLQGYAEYWANSWGGSMTEGFGLDTGALATNQLQVKPQTYGESGMYWGNGAMNAGWGVEAGAPSATNASNLGTHGEYGAGWGSGDIVEDKVARLAPTSPTTPGRGSVARTGSPARMMATWRRRIRLPRTMVRSMAALGTNGRGSKDSGWSVDVEYTRVRWDVGSVRFRVY